MCYREKLVRCLRRRGSNTNEGSPCVAWTPCKTPSPKRQRDKVTKSTLVEGDVDRDGMGDPDAVLRGSQHKRLFNMCMT